jgi:hypothetical protein
VRGPVVCRQARAWCTARGWPAPRPRCHHAPLVAVAVVAAIWVVGDEGLLWRRAACGVGQVAIMIRPDHMAMLLRPSTRGVVATICACGRTSARPAQRRAHTPACPGSRAHLRRAPHHAAPVSAAVRVEVALHAPERL